MFNKLEEAILLKFNSFGSPSPQTENQQCLAQQKALGVATKCFVMNIQHDIYILFSYRTFKAKEIASKMCA